MPIAQHLHFTRQHKDLFGDAICAGPEADDDAKTRDLASATAGLLHCLVGLVGLGGATVISLFLIAPKALVATIAGHALLSTIGNSLSHALSDSQNREAALITFMTTVSGISVFGISVFGISFFGIGAAFWALVIGLIVNQILAKRPQTNTAAAQAR
nr:benzoate/H(+) symporter BenE family transporter [Parasedimentitalea psychrophila]